MKTASIFALLSLIYFSANATLTSSFPSEVEGLSIPNAHLVAEGTGSVYRGSAPLGKAQELKDFGITDVLIFKNETGKEVSQEISELKSVGFKATAIHHIPFPWKDITDYKSVCNQVTSALNVLKEVYETKGRSVFFHCTVGEDRTGLLAGLFSQLTTSRSSIQTFESELCEKGYEAGDPHKGVVVSQTVRKNLTPLFQFLSQQIESKNLTLDRLNELSCDEIDQRITMKPSLKCSK